MDCCILVRLDNGKVVALQEDDGSVATWSSLDAAIKVTVEHHLCRKLPYQIVCLDEL